ncbi:MAG: hypothetical protein LBC18_06455, partial [Opitutaceae bacterium]|nr:hypothetical protein [Opitutaceae bacterium]
MKPKTILILLLLSVPGLRELSAADPMSPAYWERWNPEAQAKIDRDIEKNRMADAVIKLPAGIPAGIDIKIEQITHDVIFGANIFNFNQLGTSGRNQKYRDLFGPFFNSATIAFYWKNFEPEPGKLRFAGTYEDSEEFWNKHENPKKHPYW